MSVSASALATTTAALDTAAVEDLQGGIHALDCLDCLDCLDRPDRLDCLDLDADRDASYWEPEAMAPLNARSAAAVARLRAFCPPAFPLWDRLPLSRRAAVLVLLYADRRGDLRVVLTMRAASLRSFSGHAAFPGGKADTLAETPEQIARREAWEEIGLPVVGRLQQRFRIEHLCRLPHSLAKTELVVRPCVALLSVDEAEQQQQQQSTDAGETPSSLTPRLDAKEVAAVFSAPFANFLRATDEDSHRPLPPGPWYEGEWMDWHGQPWRMHYFYVPVVHQHVATPEEEDEKTVVEKDAAHAAQLEDRAGRYKVWGMTARILVEAAQLAYDEAPAFEYNDHFGDEDMIDALARQGRLGPKASDLRAASQDKDAKM